MNHAYKKKIIDLIMRGLYCIIYPLVYKIACLKKIKDKKVLLIEMREEKLGNSFTCIYDALKEENYEISICYVRRNFCGHIEYVKRSLQLLIEIADARYAFLTEGCNVLGAIKKRNGTKIIQLWHGCGAFKKFGHSTVGLLGGAEEDILERYPNYKNLDYVTVSSSAVIWAYAEAMDIHKECILPIGVSRTDVFFNQSFGKEAIDKLHTVFPQSKEKKVILYAPTFRGDLREAQSAEAFDVSIYEHTLKENYVIILKHHPFVKNRPVISEEYAEFAMDVTDKMSIEECLWNADLCISDYSSLIFEYSLFEKPMIFFAYDKENYADWRGFYYGYEEFTPGPVCLTNEAVIQAVLDLEKKFDKKIIREFRNKFMASCDGMATQRIMHLLTESYKDRR